MCEQDEMLKEIYRLRAVVREYEAQPIEITVKGGIAECTYCPDGLEVKIMDLDAKNLGERLTEKIGKEYEEFRASVIKLNSSKVYDKAYEIQVKRQILYVVYQLSNNLDTYGSIVNYLLSLTNTLESIYLPLFKADIELTGDNIRKIIVSIVEGQKG